MSAGYYLATEWGYFLDRVTHTITFPLEFSDIPTVNLTGLNGLCTFLSTPSKTGFTFNLFPPGSSTTWENTVSIHWTAKL